MRKDEQQDEQEEAKGATRKKLKYSLMEEEGIKSSLIGSTTTAL